MPEDITGGPGGWPKTPRGGGVFATATPQVFYWAYIHERTLSIVNTHQEHRGLVDRGRHTSMNAHEG